MSLYGDYIREHHGDGIVEDNYGFATYRFLNEGKTIYLVDIYVHPDFRKTLLGKEMAEKVIAIGRESGATEFLGTVVPSARNSTESLQILLKFGMQLKSASDNLIVFRKDI